MTKVFQSDKAIKILTLLFLAVLVFSIFMMFASDAFAAGGPDVGKNIGTWLKEQALWLAIGVIAVSYTHLDVYKRQLLHNHKRQQKMQSES